MKHDPNPQWRRTYMLIILGIEAFLSVLIIALSAAAYWYLEGYSEWQIFSKLRIPVAIFTLVSALVHFYKVMQERVLLCAIIIVNSILSIFWLVTTILQLLPIIMPGSPITGISNQSCSDLAAVDWRPDYPKDNLPHFRKACTGDELLVAAFPFCIAISWLSLDITGRAIVAWFRLRNYRALGVKRVSWFSKTTSVSSIKEVVDNSPNAPGFDPSRPFFENGVWYNYRAIPIGNNHSLSSNDQQMEQQWEQIPIETAKPVERQPIGLSKLARVAVGIHSPFDRRSAHNAPK